MTLWWINMKCKCGDQPWRKGTRYCVDCFNSTDRCAISHCFRVKQLNSDFLCKDHKIKRDNKDDSTAKYVARFV